MGRKIALRSGQRHHAAHQFAASRFALHLSAPSPGGMRRSHRLCNLRTDRHAASTCIHSTPMRRFGHAFAVALTSTSGMQAEVAGHHAHNAASVGLLSVARQDVQSEKELHVSTSAAVATTACIAAAIAIAFGIGGSRTGTDPAKLEAAHPALRNEMRGRYSGESCHLPRATVRRARSEVRPRHARAV